MNAKPPIAVTVVGGYLGAGKTTLVNHLLRHADERVAVLINDFGALNIDANLIAARDGETMTLANGCICCSLVDGLAASLSSIDKLSSRPSRLVIEASGVANPGTVSGYAYRPGFTLDAVLVLADAETLMAKAQDRWVGETIVEQLRAADIVVLNKIDLVDAGAIAATTAWMAGIAPGVPVITAIESVVDPALVLGVELATPSRRAESSGAAEAADLFDSWSFERVGPINRGALEAMLAGLPDGIVRVKGIVYFDDDPAAAFVVQVVGARQRVRPAAPDRIEAITQRGLQPVSQLVAIGAGGQMSPDWMESSLRPT